MAEKLRLALPRPERMDAAVAAVLPELASGSAALRRLGEAIAELDQLRKPLQFEPIELGDLSMGMLADWKERAPSHSLELALPGELPTVLASPRYAPLALNILIEAGVSMAPSGSPVRVSIRPQNESVLVSVQYAGAPLSDGDLDRLFEPYFRPEALPHFQVGGGIGLTLARAVLLAHGGRLWAESSLGGEITALLATWPLIPAPPTTPPVVAPPPGRLSLATEGPVILVLDTDSRMLRYLRANLDAQRYKPVLAKNVDEMWKLIDLEEPDLLILGMDSIAPADTADLLLELQAQLPVPIICLAGESDPLERARLLDLGASDRLVKPLALEELLASIRAALRSRQAVATPPKHSSRFQTGELCVDFGERRVTVGEKQIALSKTEFKLLRVLAEHAGMVMPHEALLSRVWGASYGAEVEFVWVYIRRLRKKIEPEPGSPTYIQTIPGVGYRLVKQGQV